VTRTTPPLVLLPLLFATVTGCEQRAPLVYVLESPQAVTLSPSASPATVRHGETVVLSVKRRTTGVWKQIPRDELKPGQCWVYRPPAAIEEEAADNVEWEMVPENGMWLNTEYRMDHTRVATTRRKGTVTLKPRSPVKCEPDRVVEGPAIQIQVV
jgi:hypothetical protein